VTKFTLSRWDFKVIERELVAQGLVPLTDFDFAWDDSEEPNGWMIQFYDDEAALVWRLQHGNRWM
jgi:hypothetical protein